ncbi:CocE/NonD family hydrolase [Mycolicibacterium sp.]|uniref:CocE/NonD family hydrolase n=1 Tax=Mycolicibacterium sp. TaxID=2320850 RepID=UPI001A255D50|nr:CocE/NonD family hydrolase [Mycolicibacterium sp.]MBJ7339483.1 CocE/NonD family hydrolase [Mycolicibacterium sp.]
MTAKRVASHALSRLLRLPPPTTDFTVIRGLRVPMRDGVDLIAHHYSPHTAAPAGTLLVRCPYGRAFPFSTLFGAVYAARGYHVVIQSVRGTFGSGGEFTPMIHEVADGADTVAWLREQEWFTGSFATIGLSYLGFTQWALLMDPPPEMAAAIISVGPHDFSESSWGTGSFTINDFLGWSDMMSHQEDGSRLLGALTQGRSRRRVARTAREVPMGASGRTMLGAGAPWWESWVEHPDRDDPFWAPMRLTEALDRVDIPVLLFSGWQDLFLEQTLTQFQHLRGRGVTTALTVGPWTHTEVMTKGAPIVVRESLSWLDEHLAGRPTPPRSPVRTFVNNGTWLDLPTWPPQMSEHVLYLLPAHGLSTEPPDGSATPSTFTYDPADPTPTVGGRLLSAEGGYRDDTRLALRPDVADFTGEPLTTDLVVIGAPVIELFHTCDNPDNDVFVRLSEVDGTGRSTNVSEGFVRLTTDSGVVRLELDAVAHRFPAGSRLRVMVAGGSHPRFVRNLGTGEPPISGTEMKPAHHAIHHGAGGLSRVLLPADARTPSAD